MRPPGGCALRYICTNMLTDLTLKPLKWPIHNTFTHFHSHTSFVFGWSFMVCWKFLPHFKGGSALLLKWFMSLRRTPTIFEMSAQHRSACAKKILNSIKKFCDQILFKIYIPYICTNVKCLLSVIFLVCPADLELTKWRYIFFNFYPNFFGIWCCLLTFRSHSTVQ